MKYYIYKKVIMEQDNFLKDYVYKDKNRKNNEKIKNYLFAGIAGLTILNMMSLIKKNKNKWNNMNCEDLTNEKEKQVCKEYKSKIK